MDLKQALLLSHTGENQSINKLLRANLRRKGRVSVFEENIFPAWTEDFFLLNQSRLYQSLSPEKRKGILKRCNDFVLSNSYFIEKAGLAYCAKMILLAQTTEVRQIYGLIASDESVHLEWISPFVAQDLRTTPQGQFIRFISGLIEQCNANTLYFLIQTILEGWGIYYYKTLSITCQNPALQQIFANIVKDEALHHQTGIALFDPNQADDRSQILHGTRCYLEILKSGPQDIVHCIEAEVGALSFKEITQLFEDFQTELTSSAKLSIFQRLIPQDLIKKQLATLESKGIFQPYTPQVCAKRYCQLHRSAACAF